MTEPMSTLGDSETVRPLPAVTFAIVGEEDTPLVFTPAEVELLVWSYLRNHPADGGETSLNSFPLCEPSNADAESDEEEGNPIFGYFLINDEDEAAAYSLGDTAIPLDVFLLIMREGIREALMLALLP